MEIARLHGRVAVANGWLLVVHLPSVLTQGIGRAYHPRDQDAKQKKKELHQHAQTPRLISTRKERVLRLNQTGLQ